MSEEVTITGLSLETMAEDEIVQEWRNRFGEPPEDMPVEQMREILLLHQRSFEAYYNETQTAVWDPASLDAMIWSKPPTVYYADGEGDNS